MARHDDAGHARAVALRNNSAQVARIGHAVTDQQEGVACSMFSSRSPFQPGGDRHDA